MNLTHKIRLDPTRVQEDYFRRAAGTYRFVFNWALAAWNAEYESGGSPSANDLKKRFNAIYKSEFPWISETHRDCHSQPFSDLKSAWANFFENRAEKPVFKGLNKIRRSFYVANDQFKIIGSNIRLPLIGMVRIREGLRFAGKINSARVVEDCGEWFLCVSVNLGEYTLPRTGDSAVGVDLGIKTLATLSTGEAIENPRPLKNAQRRLRKAQRKLSRRVKGSNNRNKQRLVVARIHRRIRNVRHDVLHKLTTRLCRQNQTVVIEDLNVRGMAKNRRLAQAINDASFGLFRTMLEYKGMLYGNRIVVADRFFPSSKTCSSCGLVKDMLSLGERMYRCECGLEIDRDLNAALNLVQLGEAIAEVTPVETRRRVEEAGTVRCA